jgi:alpha-D-ribose 1-methylphosphonate 5-triphosphate synthase subunit PhnH
MVSDPEAADVALVTSLLKMPPLACFARPRRAARIMLIVQVCALTPFPLHAMPAGRAEARRSTVKGVSDRFWLSWSGLQHHGFEAPDLIFTCGDALSAAPGDGMVVNRL